MRVLLRPLSHTIDTTKAPLHIRMSNWHWPVDSYLEYWYFQYVDDSYVILTFVRRTFDISTIIAISVFIGMSYMSFWDRCHTIVGTILSKDVRKHVNVKLSVRTNLQHVSIQVWPLFSPENASIDVWKTLISQLLFAWRVVPCRAA